MMYPTGRRRAIRTSRIWVRQILRNTVNGCDWRWPHSLDVVTGGGRAHEGRCHVGWGRDSPCRFGSLRQSHEMTQCTEIVMQSLSRRANVRYHTRGSGQKRQGGISITIRFVQTRCAWSCDYGRRLFTRYGGNVVKFPLLER